MKLDLNRSRNVRIALVECTAKPLACLNLVETVLPNTIAHLAPPTLRRTKLDVNPGFIAQVEQNSLCPAKTELMYVSVVCCTT